MKEIRALNDHLFAVIEISIFEDEDFVRESLMTSIDRILKVIPRMGFCCFDARIVANSEEKHYNQIKLVYNLGGYDYAWFEVHIMSELGHVLDGVEHETEYELLKNDELPELFSNIALN